MPKIVSIEHGLTELLRK